MTQNRAVGTNPQTIKPLYDILYFPQELSQQRSPRTRAIVDHCRRQIRRVIFPYFGPDPSWERVREFVHRKEIADAVIMVEDPHFLSLSLRLREQYGWKIVFLHDSTLPTSFQDPSQASFLEKADLVVVDHDTSLPHNPKAIVFTWKDDVEEFVHRIDTLHERFCIVIVSYNNLDRIRDCIESIQRLTAYPAFDVIVVDNASSDDVIDYLKSVADDDSRYRIIFNTDNLGFSQANNIGLRAMDSRASHIVLLNNDTVVTKGWLTRFARWLRDDSIGLVGPVTGPGGTANEAAVETTFSDLEGMHKFAKTYTQQNECVGFDILTLAFYCVAFRRAIFELVGLLDEAFGVGSFEDDDYAMRVREKGYRVFCALDVFIHHVGRSSLSIMADSDYQHLFETNLAHFEKKWGIRWRKHTASLDLGKALEAQRSESAPRLPSPPKHNPERSIVTVVIVNYNGKHHLEACLDSLCELHYPKRKLEIIVVDNGSVDSSVEWLRAVHPECRVIANKANVGFSKAANQGAAAACGSYVAFLNNDMRVDTNWLEPLIETLESKTDVGCMGSLVLDWTGTKVDYAGRPGDAFCLDPNPIFQFENPDNVHDRYVFFASGGAMLMRTKDFHKYGGFDPRYFMYHEDVDLGWRIWGQGESVILSSDSRVYHRGGASSKVLSVDFIQGLSAKHVLWTVLKNSDELLVEKMLYYSVLIYTQRERKLGFADRVLFRIFNDFQTSLSSILASRAVCQQSKVTSDADIFINTGHPLGCLFRDPVFNIDCEHIYSQLKDLAIEWNNPEAVGSTYMRFIIDCNHYIAKW